MTDREVFGNLTDKYGEEFNWSVISFSKTEYFVNELKDELGQENIIFSNRICAIAHNDSNDDVLYLLENDSMKYVYRIYHLTYSKKNERNYPEYKEFADIQAVMKYIEDTLI